MYWFHLLWGKGFQQSSNQDQRNTGQKHFQDTGEEVDMGWGPILLKNLTTSKNNQTIAYIYIYIHIFIFITIKFLTKPLRVLEDEVNKLTN